MNRSQPKPKPRVSGDVQDQIKALAVEHLDWTATQIQDVLERDENYAGRIPTDRTIRSYVNEARAKANPSHLTVWTFAEEANALHARFVLDVLAYLNRENQEPRRTISKGKARWIIKLRLAYPELSDHLDLVNAYATGYWVREIDGQDLSVDDLYIAQQSQNWRHEEGD